MSLQKKIEDIIKEHASLFNLPFNVVMAVFMSEWKKTKEEINSKEFKTIKIPTFGKFIVSKKKLSKIDYAAKEERRNAKYGKNDGGDKTNNNQI